MSNNWRTVPLSEISDINPRLGKTALGDKELFSFVPMAAVGAADGSIDVSSKRPYIKVKKGFTPFKSGDVLFAKITPCMENGKMAVVPKLENCYGFGSTEFHVIRPKDGVDPKYVYYFVSRSDFRKDAAHHMTGAVGQKRVPTDFLKLSSIPLPPTIEDQKRIVAEIEKQFSRLDEAVTALKRIHANLKRYKAAVLKAAVEGKLTEKWRKEHPGVEPADQLLKRILAERRAKWEAEELAKMKAKGIKPKDDSWKKKYKEPAGPDTANLPELPEGWVWAKFDQVAERVTKGSSPNWQGFEYCEQGIPFVRSQNIRWGTTDFSDIAFLPPEFNSVERKSVLCEGDVLLNIVGASIGRAAIAPKSAEGGNVNQAVAVIRLLACGTSNQFALLYLLSSQAQRRIHSEKVDVARANFSLEDIREMPLPFPPLAEQNYVAAEIDRRLSVTEELEATIETNLKRAERMRQTILRRAFGGGLT